ncbi:unnamed protein product [Bubo scandiacus]
MFPPPSYDQEIYDGIDDKDAVTSMSPSTKQFGKDHGDNDVYDDIDSSDFPPLPAELKQVKMEIIPLIRNL